MLSDYNPILHLQEQFTQKLNSVTLKTTENKQTNKNEWLHTNPFNISFSLKKCVNILFSNRFGILDKLYVYFKNKSPASSVSVYENVATQFCCEDPEMFCGVRNPHADVPLAWG